ncbi:bifunctional UDP-N-acetylglucosamine diphosphorylase/glucosamine-1-phosphate N-acetyltransferase GlmU [Amnibacterium kyonggiense]|uniref:Bifunctional protein GlmU n=1 Tax=Amnibacterium kyonggiense TaxID=595671 RepID=A0A4R7FS63_9MICO|nr:bifunctional UDP-N-acetylglucosamine diphosphorylase/glucosamine-1-phosphate N-acetyltransferase GlmU [Amnibacterium kyonggiense]TDS80695.1 UDP-N-acetylglucosamine pyrophosphorylase /glucosamine-1-phosphate N-acetyltransferase [Amnibacterium kyonggiense]
MTPSPERPLAVVVLAAGQGTRMRSSRPKVLHELAGLPMLAHVLVAARALRPTRLAVVVRHERDAVAAAAAEHAPDAVIVDQDEVPGTGRALEVAVAALGGFEGDVLVLSGDVPLVDEGVLAPLLDVHRSGVASATMVTAVVPDPTGYGRVLRGVGGDVERIVEHKDATDDERAIAEINAGLYVFRSAGLSERLAALGSANAQGERYLTDLVAAARAAGERVGALVAPDLEAVAGVNDRVQLAAAARRMNDAIVRRHQRAGVTVIDPATTWIDATVTIGEDAEIRPNTQLQRATAIERGAVVGPDTTLVDTEVGEGARVNRTDATLAVIGAGADVGPFAYLRPGTRLGAKGKIGTFVETKNAVIGDGSKVPHLSYIGDTEVGERSNIGANTITANYDGVHKHRTVVGSAVRTGSHNVFVAPVTIGDGVYTGAGTVVRKDVPAGALAVNPAPQRNIEGWVEANRPGTDAALTAARVAAPEEDVDSP